MTPASPKLHKLYSIFSPRQRSLRLAVMLLMATLTAAPWMNKSTPSDDRVTFQHAILHISPEDSLTRTEWASAVLSDGSYNTPARADGTVTPTLSLGEKSIQPALSHLVAARSLSSEPLPDPEPAATWAADLHTLFQSADDRFEGEVGIYVKDLSTGHTLSFRAEEDWYLASGIKVPVAIEVLRQVEQGLFTLDDTVTLKGTDYVDGAGRTNWSPPGTEFTVNHLLKEMLQVSDNTATDLLIRKVGIDRVNQLVRDLVADDIGEITTLADVRRHAYGYILPEAFNLVGHEFIRLRQAQGEQNRLNRLAELTGVSRSDFAPIGLDGAYTAYYASRLNSGSLRAFGDILESLATGQLLTPEHTRYLMEVLRGVRTGDHRIKAGLPEGALFAHKTGTQRGRTCDLGVAELTEGRQFIIAACTRGTLSRSAAEQALRSVGEAVTRSGMLDSAAETDLITEIEAD